MTTGIRGNTAEAAVLHAFVERGFDVFTPFGGGQAVDLVIHLGPDRFLRIQCKAAWQTGGCIVFNSHSTDHGRGPQCYHGLADAFGVYFQPTQGVYLVPPGAVARFEGRLRIEPTKNNQRKRVRLARDFEIDRWSLEDLEGLVSAGVRLRLVESVAELSPT